MTEATVNQLEAQALMRHWDKPRAGDWADVLATFSLFSGVSKRRLRKLARHARFAEFARGDIVIVGGEAADSLYVILGGTAEARGKPAPRTLRTGDHFGELALLDGTRRSATVVATRELHVMRLSRGSFLRLAQHDALISLAMLRILVVQFRRLETQAAQG
jgi:CRP/FNR family transcriptional regulator, cyclic AMP receptor protein